MAHDLELSLAEILELLWNPRPWSWARHEVRDQPPSDGWVKEGISGRDYPNSRGELFLRGVLEQEGARSRLQCLVYVLVVVERGEHDNLGRPSHLAHDCARSGQPVHLAHADVHQYDVRREPDGGFDRRVSVIGLANDDDVGLSLEDPPEALSHQLLVVDDEHADTHPAIGS